MTPRVGRLWVRVGGCECYYRCMEAFLGPSLVLSEARCSSDKRQSYPIVLYHHKIPPSVARQCSMYSPIHLSLILDEGEPSKREEKHKNTLNV